MEEENPKKALQKIVLSAVLFALGMAVQLLLSGRVSFQFIVFLVSYLITGLPVIADAVKDIIEKEGIGEEFLMAAATIGAFVIGEYPEAAAVMLLYQIGEFIEDKAVDNAQDKVKSLLSIRPDTAFRLTDGKTEEVPAKEISVGEIILVRPSERVPLDGMVISGSSTLDMRALTGESLSVSVREKETVLSGSVNLSGVLQVAVTSTYENSTASRIIDLVENAAEKKAPSERLITRFAAVYTPLVVIAAIVLSALPPLIFHGGWSVWIHRALSFLVVSCPCAFVISVPLTFFCGVGACAQKGILVKGSNYLEALAKTSAVVLDKTGTVTYGSFSVVSVKLHQEATREMLLTAAAAAECYSTHPVGMSVLKAAGTELFPDTDIPEIRQHFSGMLSDYTVLPGRGVSVCFSGKQILCGNAALLAENRVPVPEAFVSSEEIGEGLTEIFAAADGILIGSFIIADEIKPDAVQAVSLLKQSGIKTIMLTGDNAQAAKWTAGAIGIAEFHAGLLPADKLAILEQVIGREKGSVCFAGDGINDAPSLARADIGIAMGDIGTDEAIEAADIVIAGDAPHSICDAIALSRRTVLVARQNIVFALVVKIALLILTGVGIGNMWLAVFGDVGVTVLAVLNALRASGGLRKENKE